MNKFKFLLTTLLFFLFVLSFPALALAADLNINCPALPTVCSKSGLDPLFSNSLDGFWYPGKSITKTLSLKNSSPGTREMAIKGTRTSGFSILENVMHISIVGGTTVIWSGSVADFYGQNKIGMGIFAPGANLNYDFTVFMSSGASDEYQNKQSVFDLTLGFWGDPISTPTPTSAPGDDGATPSAEISTPSGVLGEQISPTPTIAIKSSLLGILGQNFSKIAIVLIIIFGVIGFFLYRKK